MMKLNLSFRITILTFFLISNSFFSQEEEWETYYNGSQILDVTCRNKDLYAGTNYGIVHIDLETEEVTLHTKFNASTIIDHAKSLYINNNGNLLFGIHWYQGLIEYDGISFKSGGTLLDLTCIVEDENNDLWFGGSYGGIEYSKYDSSYGYRINYQFNSSNSPLPGNNVKSMKFDKYGNLWIAIFEYEDREETSGGLVKFDGNNWTIYNKSNSSLPTQEITCMDIDKDGNIWLGTDGHGLIKYSNDTLSIFPINPFGRYDQMVTCIVTDSTNNVWIGTFNNGVYKFDGTNWEKYNSQNCGLRSDMISSLAVDYLNRLWIGTQIGLYRLEGNVVKEFNTSNSPIPHYQISEAYSDSKGNIWIMNDDYGSPYPSDKTTASITKFDGQSFTVHNIYDVAITRYDFYSMTIDQNDNVWGITNNGLYKFDNNEWIRYPYDFIGNNLQPQKITADIFNNIWIGTYNGNLIKFDGVNFSYFGAYDNSLYEGILNCITSSSNSIYVGYEAVDFIYKIDISNSINKLKCEIIQTPAYNIRDIEIDNENNLWIATLGNGMFKKQGNTWINYKSSDSKLPTNNVVSIDTDVDGRLIAVCYDSYDRSPWEGGLLYFDGNEWKNYLYSNSNLGTRFTNGCFFDANGNIWVYGYSAISVFNPNGINIQIIESSVSNEKLYQNFPNPTNSSTIIKFYLSSNSDVSLKIYNILGQEIITLSNEVKSQGNHSIYWDGKDQNGLIVPSGIYLYNLTANGKSLTKKMMLLK